MSGEVEAWIGSLIFIIAQSSQIYHVFRRKSADDVSYILLGFVLCGNILYTTFGALENSPAMFTGNLITTILNILQVIQKIHYKKKDYSSPPLLNILTDSSGP